MYCVFGGDIIGCWKEEFSSASEVLLRYTMLHKELLLWISDYSYIGCACVPGYDTDRESEEVQLKTIFERVYCMTKQP